MNPYTMKPVFVPKTKEEKAMQRALLQYYRPENRELVRKALKLAGRMDLIGSGPECLIPAEPKKQAVAPKTNQPHRGYRGLGKTDGKEAKRKESLWQKEKVKPIAEKTSKIYLTILGILLVLIAGVGVNSAVHFASWYPTFDSLKGQWDQYFGQTADLSSVDAPNLFAGEEDELAVYYLDVGQGDAILLRQDDATMLIDTGDNGMETQLLQQLDALEITQLDVLVCTHYHADHIGGAAEVLQNIAVDRVLLPSGSANTQTYEDMLDVIDQKGIPHQLPQNRLHRGAGRSRLSGGRAPNGGQ